MNDEIMKLVGELAKIELQEKRLKDIYARIIYKKKKLAEGIAGRLNRRELSDGFESGVNIFRINDTFVQFEFDTEDGVAPASVKIIKPMEF